MRFQIVIHYRYILFVVNTDLNPERDKNALKIKVVSHKRAVSAKQKQPNNLIKPEPKKIWFVFNKNTNY